LDAEIDAMRVDLDDAETRSRQQLAEKVAEAQRRQIAAEKATIGLMGELGPYTINQMTRNTLPRHVAEQWIADARAFHALKKGQVAPPQFPAK